MLLGVKSDFIPLVFGQSALKLCNKTKLKFISKFHIEVKKLVYFKFNWNAENKTYLNYSI